MPTSLWPLLVLDVDRGDARALVFTHGAHDIHRAAIAGVGIGDERNACGLGDAARVVDHLRHRQETDVGHSETRGRRAASGHVERFEAFTRDDARIHRVGDAGGEQELRSREELPKRSGRSFHRLSNH
jgi:hypothetical protein